MKEILSALGVTVVVVVWFAIIPMLGSMLGGEAATAANTLSFSGGSIADGDTVTIGSTTFEFDVSGDGVAGGNVDVDSTSSPAVASANLETAINNDATTAALVSAVRSP